MSGCVQADESTLADEAGSVYHGLEPTVSRARLGVRVDFLRGNAAPYLVLGPVCSSGPLELLVPVGCLGPTPGIAHTPSCPIAMGKEGRGGRGTRVPLTPGPFPHRDGGRGAVCCHPGSYRSLLPGRHAKTSRAPRGWRGWVQRRGVPAGRGAVERENGDTGVLVALATGKAGAGGASRPIDELRVRGERKGFRAVESQPIPGRRSPSDCGNPHPAGRPFRVHARPSRAGERERSLTVDCRKPYPGLVVYPPLPSWERRQAVS